MEMEQKQPENSQPIQLTEFVQREIYEPEGYQQDLVVFSKGRGLPGALSSWSQAPVRPDAVCQYKSLMVHFEADDKDGHNIGRGEKNDHWNQQQTDTLFHLVSFLFLLEYSGSWREYPKE